MKNRLKYLYGAFGAAAFLLLVLYVFWYGKHEEEAIAYDLDEIEHKEDESPILALSDEQQEIAKLKHEKAAAGSLAIKVNLPGKIIFNPQLYAHLVPISGGIVREANKIVGDPVSRGEVLAVLESREMAEAKAAYLAALRHEKLTSNTLAREQLLSSQGIGPQQDFIQAQNSQEEALIEVERTRQHLFALGLTPQEITAIPYISAANLRMFELKAPFNGTIIDRHLSLGEAVNPSEKAYVIADTSHLWVELNAYPGDAQALREGLTVHITDGRGTTGEAKLIRISPVIDTQNSRILAIAELENPNGQWRPGQYINAAIDGGQLEAAVAVPCQSVMKIDNQECVFVVGPQGYEKRDVKTGHSDGKLTAIQQGLEPGENIVSGNAYILKFELTKSEPD